MVIASVPGDFAERAVKDNSLAVGDAKRALKQWLAARYGRPAFPNAFEERLRSSLASAPSSN